jgi:cellulose synthase/poly-beta-1,6-N-acetylglucosamine synthase-like glycosyltransferase
MSTPFISVVIATRNRAGLLASTLVAVSRQHWPGDRLEIVVADNGSTDDTAAVVSAARCALGAPLMRYVYVGRPGKSHAVNAAFQEIRGDLIALTDDDVQPDVDWLKHLSRAFEETGADFVAGRIKPIWSEPPPPWLSSALYGVLAVPDNGDTRQPLTAEGHAMPIGANMALRRAALTKVGGLRETFGKLEGTLRTGEDHEFFLRLLAAGQKGIYEPAALVYHWVPPERLRPAYFRRWLYQNGRDVARLEQLYPTAARRLAGVPRYLWREAARAAWTAVRALLTRDRPRGFASAARLAWFGGYLRQRAVQSRDWTRGIRRRAGAV